MFPPEIWFQILTLLPVKTLLVLRSVCKSFLSIIDDSNFTSSHLQRFPDNLRESRLLILHPNSERAIYEVREINNSAVIQNNEPLLQTPGAWYLGGSLDGLILLLSTDLDENRSPIVVLWNPSVRKHRRLSFPSSSSQVMYFGLGSIRSPCKDYKVIGMSSVKGQAWLYSLKTGAFTEISDTRYHPKFGGETVYYPGVSFDHGVAWIEYSLSMKRTNYVPRLVWFDFGTETFHYANEIPDSHPRKSPMSHNSLVVLDNGSTMGLWVVDANDQVSIWALETDTMTWTKRYKIARNVMPSPILITLRFIERNGTLTWMYILGEDRSVSVLCYDIEMQAIKYHDKFPQSANMNRCLYFESLVMLN